MKKKILCLLIICALILPFSSPATAGAFVSSDMVSVEQNEPPGEGTYVKGQVIVTVVSEDATALTKEGKEAYKDIHVDSTWNFGDAYFMAKTASESEFLSDKDYRISVVSSDVYTTEELINILKKKSYVVHVEPDYYQKKKSISNDAFVESQWHLSSSTASIHADTAWKQASGNSPVIAVVDTGVDYTHEDLASRMWVNPYTSAGLPGTYGYDYGDNDSNPMDTDGHGTHCAGTIAASVDNAAGIAGISKNTKIMALKVFNSKGSSTTSYVIAAFYYINSAMSYGANVVGVNCSWGGTGTSSSTLSDLVNKIGGQGALFSFARGNDGKNVEAGTLSLPFDMSSDYIVSVGAMTSTDIPASYSNYGPSKVTMFAPGDMILSCTTKTNLLPNIYSAEKRKALLSYYDKATNNTQSFRYYSSSDLGLAPTGMTDTLTYEAGTDFENDSGSGSYRWNITNYSGVRDTVYFYADVTDLDLDTRQDYYVSSMLGLAGKGMEWEHSMMKSSYNNPTTSNRFIKIGLRTYFRVIGIELSSGTSKTIYVDDIGITKANPDTSSFGKYEYASGTSMAAPMVSGAIAALAEAYPNDSVMERRTRLLACTRQNPALAGKCISMSTLDLSKLNYFVAVSGISLSASANTCKINKSITLHATVAPANATNPSLHWKVNNTTYASISQSGKLKALAKGGGKTVTVTATSNINPAVKASIKIKIPVQKVTKLKISKKKLTLKVGKKKKLKVSVSPSYATNKKLKWTSSSKKYATVSSSGVVKAKKAGKTIKITAQAKDGSKKKVVCRVKIIR